MPNPSRESFDQWIDRYMARVRLGEYLHTAAECGAAFLFVFGGAVLVVKMLFPQFWPHVLWGALGTIPALGAASWLARRNPRTRAESIARLDQALQTGGLLMTLCEHPDPDWAGRLPQARDRWTAALPRIRPRRFAGFLALPLLFALGACFVPLREGASASTLSSSVAQQSAAELDELLTSLEADSVLEKEEQQQLKEEIEKLAEETTKTPLTHEKWEAVDALRERMKVRLDSAAINADQAQSAAAMLAAAADPDAPELSLERADLLEKSLMSALEKMNRKGAFASASPDLQSKLQRLMKQGKLPAAAGERQELLDELQDYLEQERNKLSALRKKCSSCKSGECLSDCEGQCEGAQCTSNRPGRGGTSRGRGDADLTWGDESDKAGTKFKEVVLPRGFLDQPKDETVGIERTAPQVEAAESAPRSERRNADPATGRAAWNRQLSPRHRNVVKQYFQSR